MGIVGAGYATALANLIAASVALYVLWKHPVKKQSWSLREGFDWERLFFSRYLKLGIPSGLQWSLEGLSFAVFLIILGSYQNGDAARGKFDCCHIAIASRPSPDWSGSGCVSPGWATSGENRPEQAVVDTWSGFSVALAYISVMALSFVLIPTFTLVGLRTNKTQSFGCRP